MNYIPNATADLIAEARGAFKATNASASLIRRLADALEAATRAPEQGEAVAAIGRVCAAIEEHKHWNESCGWDVPAIEVLAALDGAPEPVRAGKEYRRVKPDGFPVYHATFESMPTLDEGWSAEYRSFTAWLPAEGESK